MKPESLIEKVKKDRVTAEQGQKFQEAASLSNYLGYLYAENGQYEEALEAHQYELHLCEALGDRMGVGVAHRRIGECLMEMDDKMADAIQHQKKFLAISQEEKNQTEEQRAYATLGRTYLRMADSEVIPKKLERVLAFAEEALHQSYELSDCLKSDREGWEMKARALLNLGLLSRRKKNTEKCKKYLREALLISKEKSFAEITCLCLDALSEVARKNNSREEAVRLSKESVKCAQKTNHKVKLKEAYGQLGLIYLHFQEFSEAKHVLKKAHKKLKDVPDSEPSVERLLTTAIKCVKLSHELQDKAANYDQSIALNEKLGDIYADIKLFEPALQCYLEVEKISKTAGKAEKSLAAIYSSIAQTYADLEQYDCAVEYYTKEMACRPNDYEQLCTSQLNVIDCMERFGRDYTCLQTVYDSAMKNAQQSGNKKLQLQVLSNMAASQGLFDEKDLQAETEQKIAAFTLEHNLDMSDENDDEPVEVPDVNLDNLSSTDDSSADDDEEFNQFPPVISSTGRAKRTKRVKRNEKGETPLHTAAIQGNLKRVIALLENDHPTNVRDNCGWLPLHEAANHGFAQIVAALLDHGADINDKGGPGCEGITPLHDACVCGNVDVIELLVRRGADVHAKDLRGNTPLDSLYAYCKNSQVSSEEIEELCRAESVLLEAMKSTNKSKLRQLSSSIPSTNCDEITPSNKLPNITHHQRRSRLKRGSKRKRSRTGSGDDLPCSSIDEEEDEPDLCPTFPGLDPVETNLLENPLHARNAYSNVISGLGSHAHVSSSGASSRKSKSSQSSALLAEGEVGEDWMVDDMAPLRRVRARLSPSPRPHSEMGTEDDIQLVEHPRSPSPALVSQMDYVAPSDQQLSASPALSSGVMKIKVQVEDKLILLPLLPSDQSQKVSWLAEAVSLRYLKLYETKPILRLSTCDGAVLFPEDSINTILVNDQKVIGIVERWEMPSVHSRYRDACSAMKSRPFKNVVMQMQKSENDGCLDLSFASLMAKHFLPISQALLNHDKLTVLDLKGNHLGDVGLNHLVNSLPTLCHLRSLGLSSCQLDSYCLSLLTQCYDKQENQPSFKCLECLDLSYNTLGNECSSYLTALLKQTVALKKLYLSSCGFTERLFTGGGLKLADALKALELSHLDVSQNKFGSAGVESLLRILKDVPLEYLNLSGVTSFYNDNIICHLANFLSWESVSQLKTLIIDSCHLCSGDISEICSILRKYPFLSHLSLSQNVKLANKDFLRLLESGGHYQSLTITGCGLSSPVDLELLDALNDQLFGERPLQKLCASFSNLSISQCDSFYEIWTNKWQEAAVCERRGSEIRLRLKIN